jgi:hypothetical protein
MACFALPALLEHTKAYPALVRVLDVGQENTPLLWVRRLQRRVCIVWVVPTLLSPGALAACATRATQDPPVEHARNALPENTKARSVVKFAQTVTQENTLLLLLLKHHHIAIHVRRILKVCLALVLVQQKTAFATRGSLGIHHT